MTAKSVPVLFKTGYSGYAGIVRSEFEQKRTDDFLLGVLKLAAVSLVLILTAAVDVCHVGVFARVDIALAGVLRVKDACLAGVLTTCFSLVGVLKVTDACLAGVLTTDFSVVGGT